MSNFWSRFSSAAAGEDRARPGPGLKWRRSVPSRRREAGGAVASFTVESRPGEESFGRVVAVCGHHGSTLHRDAAMRPPGSGVRQ